VRVTDVVGIGLVAGAGVSIALAVRFWIRDRREHRTVLANVADRVSKLVDRPDVDAPPEDRDNAPVRRPSRYRIVRRHEGRRYEWKSGDAEQALRTWDRYLASPDTHPGALEFWDGQHCRNNVSAEERHR
jgi:hypothetical protein